MFRVVGIKHIVSRKTSVPYTELHLLSSDKYVSGSRCDVFFVRDDQISNIDCLTLDCNVDIVFNRYGRVDSVSVLI